MHIAHYGPLSPHVHQFMRLLGAAGVSQEACLAGEEPLRQPSLVLVHQANELGLEIIRWAERGVPVVARLWNLRWLQQPGAELRLHALSYATSILGWPMPAPPELAGLPYRPMYPLVPGVVFHATDEPRTMPIFCPRLVQRDIENIYWSQELMAALPPSRAYYASGWMPPHIMAANYRQAQVVVSTGLDPYISSSAMEAALCGAVLVLSDTPANRAEFGDGGARFCTQDQASILRAVAEVTELWRDSPEEYTREGQRNVEHFLPWRLEAAGAQLTADILALAQVAA